jgi:glycosyltransferase involved in cell wall biosynthesis
MTAVRKLIVIPAWNEQGAIGAVVARCLESAAGFDVVVVDDGSTDETAARALEAGATVVRHPFNMRYGAALQTGYRYAVRRGYDLVVQIDADGQHDGADAPRLAEPIETGQADLVLGSRFTSGKTYRMPLLKRLGVAWFRTLLRTFTGLPLTDPTSGLQALSRGVFELYASEVFPFDYPDADVLLLLHRNGFRIREVPVVMDDRPASPSMHTHVTAIYYVYKMTLAILMNLLRPLERDAARRPIRGA